MTPSRYLRLTATVLCLAIPQLCLAQNKIPYDVVTATTVLSNVQRQHIDRYLNERVANLLDGTLNEIVQARKDLIEPLTWAGSTEIFHLAYSSAASNRLAPAVNSDQPEVRLNAMIVVNSLNDPGTVFLIQKGLTDPNPAVRYWAGKAVNQITTRSELSEQEQRTLLESLASAMSKETSERVLQRLLVGLVGLNIPEAATELLDGLNSRIDLHAVNPSMPLQAEIDGLRTLFVKTVQANSNGQNIPVPTVRQMALVAYRYLTLSSALLDMDRPSQEAHLHHQNMIKLTDAILRWTAQQMPPQVPQPVTVKNELASQNWQLIRLRAEEWRRVLSLAPFNFGPIDLIVTIPDHS